MLALLGTSLHSVADSNFAVCGPQLTRGGGIKLGLGLLVRVRSAWLLSRTVHTAVCGPLLRGRGVLSSCIYSSRSHLLTEGAVIWTQRPAYGQRVTQTVTYEDNIAS